MTAPGARRQKYDPFGDLLEGGAALLIVGVAWWLPACVGLARACYSGAGCGLGLQRHASRALVAMHGIRLADPTRCMLTPLPSPTDHSHSPPPDPEHWHPAGEWLEADYQEQISKAANTAASRLFGSTSGTGNGVSGRSSSPATPQEQEQRSELATEWS